MLTTILTGLAVLGLFGFLGGLAFQDTLDKLVDEWRLERKHRRKLREIEAARDARLLDAVFTDDEKAK